MSFHLDCNFKTGPQGPNGEKSYQTGAKYSLVTDVKTRGKEPEENMRLIIHLLHEKALKYILI